MQRNTDFEVPAPSTDGAHVNKLDYSIPTSVPSSSHEIVTNKNESYDKPRSGRQDARTSSWRSESSRSGANVRGPSVSALAFDIDSTVPPSGVHERSSTTIQQSSYDVPKDTINEKFIKISERCGPGSSGSPTKQPLLPSSIPRGNAPKSPPPTILLSPPEEHSPEKAKVIFEYEHENGQFKSADEVSPSRPNFLVRNKKLILITALIALVLLVISLVVTLTYALNSS